MERALLIMSVITGVGGAAALFPSIVIYNGNYLNVGLIALLISSVFLLGAVLFRCTNEHRSI